MTDLLIDITRLLYRRMKGRLPTGIDRVGLEYVRHFGDRARAVLSYAGRTAVLPRSDSTRAFGALADSGAHPALGTWLFSRSAAWDWLFAGPERALLVNTGHYGLEEDEYAATLRRRGGRLLTFVHDLIPIRHPEYCRAGDDVRHAVRMRNALRLSSGIVVNSHDTLEALRGFAGRERLSCPPMLVAPLASSLPAASAGPRPLDEPYFVVLGTIEPRKNHRLLLDIWSRLIEATGRSTPKLIVIGQRGWHCEDVVELLERGTLLRGVVLERKSCSDAELLAWLSHARALLMPSRVEGYGLPVAEALAAGVPVIASDLPVFREIGGSIPDYADPAQEGPWLDLVRDYAVPRSARREAQLARMVGFSPTTWAQHFAAVDAFIASLPGAPYQAK